MCFVQAWRSSYEGAAKEINLPITQDGTVFLQHLVKIPHVADLEANGLAES